MGQVIQLTALKQTGHDYYDYLRDAAGIFEVAIRRLNDENVPQSDLDAARIMAHKIKGNAFMYGYANLGEQAAIAESLLLTDAASADRASTHISLIKLAKDIHDIREAADALQENPAYEDGSVFDESELEIAGFKTAYASAKPVDKRKSVVIAYQDAWLNEFIRSLLEPQFRVVPCMTAQATLRAVMAEPVDLIVAEYDMGDMDGLQFLQKLKDLPQASGANIIMAFSGDTHSHMADAVSAGICGFVNDKFDVLFLAEQIRNTLERPADRVLVVDDDAAVRNILRHSLESQGYNVDTAEDGIEALDYLAKRTPDLIILDRLMPRLQGGTVLYEIQNKINLKSIPVLIITAMTNRGEAKNWFERGAADFIPKPFDPQEVSMRVKQHLETKRRYVC